MSKIQSAFTDKNAFIPFLTVGDPSLDKTYEFILEMEKAGAALIELGIPFSDPIAEGPVIQMCVRSRRDAQQIRSLNWWSECVKKHRYHSSF